MGGGDESGAKEFDPSQQKLKRLREQGSVPKSRELSQLMTFIAVVFFLVGFSDYVFEQIKTVFLGLFNVIESKTIWSVGAGYIVEHSFVPFVKLVIPLFSIAAGAAIISDVLQVGIMFSIKSLAPNLNKFNPINYFKNTFGPKGFVELGKQIIKVPILGIIAFQVISKYFPEMITLIRTMAVDAVWQLLIEVIVEFTIKSTIALLVITVADFLFQRFQFTKDNRMTRKEMMDEQKQSEGDPQMKQQRKAMARSLTQRQQSQDVPTADFVTTNPHKVAVAVRYDANTMNAPKVIAKGGDSFAWRIINIATESEVPIITNVPVARALYRLVKVGGYVPPELYRAVAEILLFAYRVRGKNAS